jgi:hypothetical protein
MAKKRSESLFNDLKDNSPPKELSPKDDYIFKDELKKAFEKKAQMQKQLETPEDKQNRVVSEQISNSRVYAVKKENSLIKIVNERRKRHYCLNGDVKVYCYVRNEWPKLIIKPLTIKVGDVLNIPSLGPFNKENEILLEATFRPITVGMKNRIDPFIYEPMDENSQVLGTNIDEYKKLAFFLCFKKWNIPFDLPFNEDGSLAYEAMEIIENKAHPYLIDVLSSEFLSLNNLSERESNLLNQQCEKLFGKGNDGVSNPLEGIKLYCEASVFAKEFALSGKELSNLPIRISSMIRNVSQKGNEIHIKELNNIRNKPKNKSVGRKK